MQNLQNTPQSPTNQDNTQSPYIINYNQPYQNQQTQNPQQGIPVFMPIIYDPQNMVFTDQFQRLEKPILNTVNSNEIQNLPFSEQKTIFVKILALITVGTVIEYFFLFGLMALLYEIIDSIAIVMFPLSLIALLAVAKFGVDKVRKQIFQKIYPIIVYILLCALTAQTLLFFSRSFDHTKPPKEDGIYFTTADVVLMGVMIQICVNGCVTLSLLFYLLIESKRISYLPILLFLCFCTIISIIVFWLLFVIGLFAILYAILLINSFIQIQSGRFRLEKDNLLFNTNAVYYAILVPCAMSE